MYMLNEYMHFVHTVTRIQSIYGKHFTRLYVMLKTIILNGKNLT